MQKRFKNMVELDLRTSELIHPAHCDENLNFYTRDVHVIILWE